ncbi:MAG: hypothetical protein U0175_11410 [Caldilineaceae bacterium]
MGLLIGVLTFPFKVVALPFKVVGWLFDSGSNAPANSTVGIDFVRHRNQQFQHNLMNQTIQRNTKLAEHNRK